MAKIVHARISENGTVNGAKGDQTKNEVRVQEWYSKPWDIVLRCRDIKKREQLSDFLVALANNENIGYSQATRNTLIDELESCSYVPEKVGLCNCDCSSFVTAGLLAVGYPKEKLYKGNALTTRTMKNALLGLGDFFLLTISKYTTVPDNLIKGDILLSEGHHVAVVCEVNEKNKYFPKYDGNSDSIVDALKSLGIDGSISNRRKIAEANNIQSPGTALANITMLSLLKAGELIQP